MKKPRRRAPRRNQDGQLPIPASATVTRFDGDGAVRLQLVFQPQDALRLADFLLNAMLRGRNARK